MKTGTGSRLGVYEILSPLGAGGMGQVFKGRDTRLDRVVAVKVISEHLAGRADIRARFHREARTIATLSHPNICAIFDVGFEAGVDFLVMEYLEGESLAERLRRGRLPLQQVIRLGSQIAEALEVAHRNRIVHRDLKPGNIMLATGGAKLLDFGLARMRSDRGAPSGPSIEWETTAARLEEPLTAEGSTVGTLHYMAPEQLERGPLDGRTDIWAFGCLLYEMTTGRRPFTGSSESALITAIMAGEPDPVSNLEPRSPAALDRLIRTCLAKNPDDRWQSARDIRLQLEGMENPVLDAHQRGGWSPRRIAASFVAVVAALLLLGGIGRWLNRGGRPLPQAPEVRFALSPPAGGEFIANVEAPTLAVSPDGRSIAFIARSGSDPARVWLRKLSALESTPVAGTEGAESLTWSPDGRALALVAGGKLKRADLDSESPVPICDVSPGIGYALSWSTSGNLLFAPVQGTAIYLVPAVGGEVETVVRIDRAHGVTRVGWPVYLSDGRRFLYLARGKELEGTLMLAEPGHPARTIGPLTSRVEFISADSIVFSRDGQLVVQKIDLRSARMIGATRAIAPKVRYFISTAQANFAASPAGTLVWASERDVSQIAWFDRAGERTGTVADPGDILGLALSPDGHRLLFDRARPDLGSYDVWMSDLDRGVETPVTSDPDTEFGGVWAPDGRSIIYSVVHGEVPYLVRRDLATGREEPLLPNGRFQVANDISRDGVTLAYVEQPSAGRFRGWTMNLTGEHRPQSLGQFSQDNIRFSPDGSSMAWLSNESGRVEAYLALVGRIGERVRLSQSGAVRLQWARNGGRSISSLPTAR